MSLTDNNFVKIIKDLATYFYDYHVPYVLIGGLAVNIWGCIRTTMVADFIFDQNKINLEKFTTSFFLLLYLFFFPH